MLLSFPGFMSLRYLVQIPNLKGMNAIIGDIDDLIVWIPRLTPGSEEDLDAGQIADGGSSS